MKLSLLLRSALLSKICPISVNWTLIFLNWTSDITCTFVHLFAAIFFQTWLCIYFFWYRAFIQNQRNGTHRHKINKSKTMLVLFHPPPSPPRYLQLHESSNPSFTHLLQAKVFNQWHQIIHENLESSIVFWSDHNSLYLQERYAKFCDLSFRND